MNAKKRILVLGGAGFIGSYIVRELLAHGHEIVVIDNFSKYGYIEHDWYKHPNCKLEIKDVRMMGPAEYRGFDVVVCLAALIGGIKYFHRIPYHIARDNTEILCHAIDATLLSAPEATFIYFSSSMVYERVQRPVTEEDAREQPVPITNYGMQKLFGEYVTTGAHDECGLNYLVIRPFNAVGSGELPEVDGAGAVQFGMSHVIPDFIYKALVCQTPFEIFGDGQQVRTFTHARDIAEGLRTVIEKNVKNDNFNLCGSNTYAMGDLAKMVWAKVNPSVPFPGFDHQEVPPSDVRFRVGTGEKAAKILGWKPKYDIEAILQDTIDYIRTNMPTLQEVKA
jgi:nucleoside-diphosphate-sugar epimerase